MSIMPARSTALAPGGRADLVQKARAFAADLLVLDLEDAVPFAGPAKDAARALVADALRAGGFAARQVAVRVNGPSTPWFAADLAAIAAAGARAVTLPHIASAAEALAAEAAIVAALGPCAIHLAVETPGLLLELEEVARRAGHIVSLSVAPNDYSLETGSGALLDALVAGRPSVAFDDHLAWLRLKVLAVARARGWAAIDAPTIIDADDAEGARRALRRSRDLGFDGVAVLQPRFIAMANEVFTPSAAERDWAGRIVADFGLLQAGGTPARPVMRQQYELARRVLARAAACAGGGA